METVDISASVQHVVLAGRLDSAGVGRLETAFTATLSGSGKDAIVDLAGVEFCGSLAIRMFLAVARVMQRRGRRMVIAAAQPQVLEVFTTVALGQIVPVVGTLDEAKALLPA